MSGHGVAALGLSRRAPRLDRPPATRARAAVRAQQIHARAGRGARVLLQALVDVDARVAASVVSVVARAVVRAFRVPARLLARVRVRLALVDVGARARVA